MLIFLRHFFSHVRGFAGALFMNRNEKSVRLYSLPPISHFSRDELISLLKSEVYGVVPTELPESSTTVVEEGEAFAGTAVRKQIVLTLSRGSVSVPLHILMYIPKYIQKPAIVFSANFDGNYSVTPDEHVIPTQVWSRRFAGRTVPFHENLRNKHENRFPVRDIVKRGYAVVTFCYGDADPDFDDGFKNGVHSLYPELQKRADNWTSVGAWAWSFSRVLDFLLTEKDINATHTALYGFSRLGKSVLLAGALDQRFSAVIAEGSGKGGASLSRRNFGESASLMNARFPHWFSRAFHEKAKTPSTLVVDQHALLSLIAPRSLLLLVGKSDWWSDPEGTRRALDEAHALYSDWNTQLFLPAGGHRPTVKGWSATLDFLDRTFT